MNRYVLTMSIQEEKKQKMIQENQENEEKRKRKKKTAAEVVDPLDAFKIYQKKSDIIR